MSARTTAPCGIVLALVGFASPASAEFAGARWWVDTAGDACTNEKSALKREIALACGAVEGTCRVVDSIAEAELVALLRCPSADGAWTLETSTTTGRSVGSLELSGPVEDRLRQAAVEVARDEAPERTLAAGALENTLTGPVDRDDARTDARRVVDVALAGVTSAESGGTHFGGRAALGLELHGDTSLVLSAGGMTTGDRGIDTRYVARAGVGVTWGAPFVPTKIVGGSIDVGATFAQSYVATANPAIPQAARTDGGMFGQISLFFQIPRRGIRPYLGLNGIASAIGGDYPLGAGAELGILVPVMR